MDIFRFINSDDIREHLREIRYEFSPLEMAWIVSQCFSATLQEKYDAWEEIINTMDDTPLPSGIKIEGINSLHKLLTAYMELTNKRLEEFESNAPDSIYQYKTYYRNDGVWCDGNAIQSSLDGCWEKINEEKDENIIIISIWKEQINTGERKIEVEYDKDNQIMSVNTVSTGFPDEENALLWAFDDMWFGFPVPFKKGDVLLEKLPDRPYGNLDRGPIAIVGVANVDDEYERVITKDVSDMNVYGYWLNENGTVYYEVSSWNYMDYEYYKGPYEGKYRFLKALGNHLKGDVNLEMLLCAYRKCLLDEAADDIMLRSWFGDWQKEQAGL